MHGRATWRRRQAAAAAGEDCNLQLVPTTQLLAVLVTHIGRAAAAYSLVLTHHHGIHHCAAAAACRRCLAAAALPPAAWAAPRTPSTARCSWATSTARASTSPTLQRMCVGLAMLGWQLLLLAPGSSCMWWWCRWRGNCPCSADLTSCLAFCCCAALSAAAFGCCCLQADAIVINTCGFVEDAKDESIEVRWQRGAWQKMCLAEGCGLQRGAWQCWCWWWGSCG